RADWCSRSIRCGTLPDIRLLQRTSCSYRRYPSQSAGHLGASLNDRKRPAHGSDSRLPIAGFAKKTIAQPISYVPSITQAGYISLIDAHRGTDRDTLRVTRVLGNDVDDPIDRVGAPQGSAGAANYLDALNVFQRQILQIPVNAPKLGGVDTAPIYQHQHLVIQVVAESTSADRPPAFI